MSRKGRAGANPVGGIKLRGSGGTADAPFLKFGVFGRPGATPGSPIYRTVAQQLAQDSYLGRKPIGAGGGLISRVNWWVRLPPGLLYSSAETLEHSRRLAARYPIPSGSSDRALKDCLARSR